jgi:phosphatidate cytidylyltransferase
VTGDMAQPPAPAKGGGLGVRVASALVMLPLAVVTVWLGSWWFAILLAVICAAMSWEWGHICSPRVSTVGWTMMAAGAAAPFLNVAFGFTAVLWTAAAGVAALILHRIAGRLDNPVICIPGLVYVVIGISCIGLLRADADAGLATVLWAAASVVATDVGAYFVGRSVGGPKLAPVLSPNKTWSGLLGGMGCAALAGVVTAAAMDGSFLLLAITSAALAAISQGGDLIESALKRHFQLKDASQLIPGHGGFLDRFDGYLTAMPAVAVMSALSGGSPVTWQ